MGRDELGRFVWYSVADGGSGIEVDEESHSRQRRSGTPLPRIVVERAPEVVFSAGIETHGHTGGCPGCAALASHGRATKPQNNECRERNRTIFERTLTGKARMNAYKDRIAETEQVKERKRARVERGAGDVPMESGKCGADGGSMCGRTWRGRKTTRREQNERHPLWHKRIGDSK